MSNWKETVVEIIRRKGKLVSKFEKAAEEANHNGYAEREKKHVQMCRQGGRVRSRSDRCIGSDGV